MRAWTWRRTSDTRGAAPAAVAAAVNAALRHPAAKTLAFVLASLPLLHLIWGAWADTLGANPAQALSRGTGDWTLRLLCATLAVTPLREAFGWHALLRLRRMLGLWTFAYALAHLLCYAWLDMGFDAAAIVRDIPKRPFVLVGTLAFVLLLPLAGTSFDRAVRALGGRRWRALHRSVYAIALLAVLHFLWARSAKNDLAEVAVYAAIVALLLGWRLRAALRRQLPAR